MLRIALRFFLLHVTLELLADFRERFADRQTEADRVELVSEPFVRIRLYAEVLAHLVVQLLENHRLVTADRVQLKAYWHLFHSFWADLQAAEPILRLQMVEGGSPKAPSSQR
jgi:hypothetical protein